MYSRRLQSFNGHHLKQKSCILLISIVITILLNLLLEYFGSTNRIETFGWWSSKVVFCLCYTVLHRVYLLGNTELWTWMNVLNTLFGNRDGFSFHSCYWFKTLVVYFEVMLCVSRTNTDFAWILLLIHVWNKTWLWKLEPS